MVILVTVNMGQGSVGGKNIKLEAGIYRANEDLAQVYLI